MHKSSKTSAVIVASALGSKFRWLFLVAVHLLCTVLADDDGNVRVGTAQPVFILLFTFVSFSYSFPDS